MFKNKSESNELIIKFLRLVRDSQSQEELSLLLNYDFNIWNRWENNRRGFYWEDFLHLAKHKKWNVDKVLLNVTHFKFTKSPSSSDILNKIITSTAMGLLKAQVSPSKINRLKLGKSKLLFSDFLLILDVIYGRNERFFRQLVPDIAKQLFGNSELLSEEVKASSDPIFFKVKSVLIFNAYKELQKHSSQFIADILSVSVSEVDSTLKILEKLNRIKFEKNKYIPTNIHIDTGAKNQELSRLQANAWRKEISHKIDEKKENYQLMSAFLSYSSNAETDAQIFELCRKFYIDLKNIVSASEGIDSDRIRYLGVDLYQPMLIPDDKKSKI